MLNGKKGFALLIALGVILFLSLPVYSSTSKNSSPRPVLKFGKNYWDIDSEKRLKALDVLKDEKTNEAHRLLYIASHWDPEDRVRIKAFRLLAHAEDRDGGISRWAADSFRREEDFDVKARKADLMSALRFRYFPLRELCGYVAGYRYPLAQYGWPYYHHHVLLAPPGHSFSGRHSGGIGAVCHGDWNGVERQRAQEHWYTVFSAINELGKSDFEAHRGIAKEIRDWWAMKESEFREVDRRLYEKGARLEQRRGAWADGLKAKASLMDLLMIDINELPDADGNAEKAEMNTGRAGSPNKGRAGEDEPDE